ncbi:MAG: hypothetical protein ACXVRH_04660 [Thermoleophilaceae bacterium]
MTRNSALADLGAGRLDLYGEFETRPGGAAQLSSTVRYGDGSSCIDPHEPAAMAPLFMQSSGKTAHFEFDPYQESAGDNLRTYCQGPSEEDVVGRSALASADVPPAQLVAPTLRVPISGGSHSFQSGAYGGSRSGEIDIDFVRTALRVKVFRVRVGR